MLVLGPAPEIWVPLVCATLRNQHFNLSPGGLDASDLEPTVRSRQGPTSFVWLLNRRQQGPYILSIRYSAQRGSHSVHPVPHKVGTAHIPASQTRRRRAAEAAQPSGLPGHQRESETRKPGLSGPKTRLRPLALHCLGPLVLLTYPTTPTAVTLGALPAPHRNAQIHRYTHRQTQTHRDT